MPTNRICQLFERKLRQTKSTSNIFNITTTQGDRPSSQQSRPKSRESLSVSVEYNFNQHGRPSTYPSPSAPAVKAVNPNRASTTPLIQPPDELFLSMVRRRSANARLERNRIQDEQLTRIDEGYGRKNTLPTPVAVAYALPPQYFDLPPAYESPQHIQQRWTPPPVRSRATIVKPRGPELFLEDDLHLQIDQAIAEFRGFMVTEATPVQTTTPETNEAPVSPINEIDNIYLERRRQRREQRQQQRQSLTTM